jgi:hypothetical protein
MVVNDLWRAIPTVDAVYERHGFRECWINSANDGEHHGKPVIGGSKDPHYEGKAVDFHMRDLGDAMARSELFTDIKASLTSDFVLVWEDQGTMNEHWHLQWGHIA